MKRVPVVSMAVLSMAVLSMALAGLLAGCSADAPPSAVAPAAASPAVSSPVLSPPGAAGLTTGVAGLPVAARPRTAEGAAVFARYWYAQLLTAFRSGDATTLRAMSTAACQTCRRTIASVVRLRDNRERIKVDLTVLSASTPRLRSGQPVLVDVMFNSQGQHGTTPPVRSSPASRRW